MYTASRNRQSQVYTVSERRSPTSIALKRIFLRCGVLASIYASLARGSNVGPGSHD